MNKQLKTYKQKSKQVDNDPFADESLWYSKHAHMHC